MLQSRLPMVRKTIIINIVVTQFFCMFIGFSPYSLPDLQPSLQDYYGITFPGPTATLSSRDGNLANPYSGKTPVLLADLI